MASGCAGLTSARRGILSVARALALVNATDRQTFMRRQATSGVRCREVHMAERALRGSRLGAVSYENDYAGDVAERQVVSYSCPNGHVIAVPFAAEADVPATWECRFCGSTATQTNSDTRRTGPVEDRTQSLGHAARASEHSRTRGDPRRAPRCDAAGRPPQERLTVPAPTSRGRRRGGRGAGGCAGPTP